MPTPNADSWKCYRCYTVLPSPGDGRAPVTCLTSLGGCGRIVDIEQVHFHPELADDFDPADQCDVCKVGTTRFFPADWSDEKCELYVDADTKEGYRLFRKVVSELERLIEFQHPWHARICTLYVFQTHFLSRLPIAFRIAARGTHGSAKTTVIQILTDLSHNGIMAGSATGAAFKRTMNDGCTIGADEIDKLPPDVKEIVLAAARQGYKRGAYYLVCDREKGNKVERINLFGAMSMNFREGIDPASMSRAYILGMARVRDELKVDKVGDNLIYLLEENHPIKKEIEEYVAKRLQEWPVSRVRETLAEPQFRERVRKISEYDGTPRDTELTYVCLLLSDMIETDIESEIATLFDTREGEESDERIEEFRELVKVFWEAQGKPPSMKRSVLRKGINALLDETKDRHIIPEKFSALLNDLGLREGHELKKIPGKGNPAVFFTEFAVKCLYPDVKIEERKRMKVSIFEFTPGEEVNGASSQELGQEVNAGSQEPRSQEEKRELLREICIMEVNKNPEKSFTPESIFTPASDRHISPEEARKWLEFWAKTGEIYESRKGVFKFV